MPVGRVLLLLVLLTVFLVPVVNHRRRTQLHTWASHRVLDWTLADGHSEFANLARWSTPEPWYQWQLRFPRAQAARDNFLDPHKQKPSA